MTLGLIERVPRLLNCLSAQYNHLSKSSTVSSNPWQRYKAVCTLEIRSLILFSISQNRSVTFWTLDLVASTNFSSPLFSLISASPLECNEPSLGLRCARATLEACWMGTHEIPTLVIVRDQVTYRKRLFREINGSESVNPRENF